MAAFGRIGRPGAVESGRAPRKWAWADGPREGSEPPGRGRPTVGPKEIV